MNKVYISWIAVVAVLAVIVECDARAEDRTFGLIKSINTGEVLLRRKLPLDIYVNLQDGEDQSYEDPLEVAYMFGDFARAAGIVNSLLAVKAVNLTYTYEPLDCDNKNDMRTRYCYRPAQYKKYANAQNLFNNGICRTMENGWYLWPFEKQNSSVRIGDISHSIIYMFLPWSGNKRHIDTPDNRLDYKWMWITVAVHEILHSLGFDHVPNGIMKEGFGPDDFQDGVYIDAIDPLQLKNWWREMGLFYHKIFGKGPKHELFN